jgi:hypothetical protein
MLGGPRLIKPLAVAAVALLYAGIAAIGIEGGNDGRAGLASSRPGSRPEAGSIGSAGAGGEGESPVGTAGGGGTEGSTRGAAGRGAGGSGGSGDSSAAGPAAGAAPAAGPAPAKGEPLAIGIRIASRSSMQAIATAFGTRGISGGDPRGYAETLVEYLNSKGGVAGHPVTAEYREVDIAGLVANPDASDQQDCDHFTQDRKVFAVLTSIPAGTPLAPCLASRGVPLVLNSPEEFDVHDLGNLHGMLSMPSIPSLNRQAPALVDALADQGFYRDAKVGLIYYDKPTFSRAVRESVKPALAAHGVKLADEVAMSSYTSSEQYSSAVLRFKAAGIDRVQFVDVSGLIALQFMQYAESQQYRPRYGLSSANSLSAIRTGVSSNQLKGAIGIGWMPSLDTDEHPGFSATAKECLDALHAAGRRTDDPVAVAMALWTCEVLWFFRAAMEHAPEATAAGFVAGLEALGDSYVPADTYAVQVGRGRYDGPAAVRRLAFRSSCSCFRYTSAPYPIH